MLSYCLKCKNNTANVDPTVLNTKNGRAMLSSKCATWGGKKSRFIYEQEESGLLSSLGIKTPLSNIPLLGKLLF